MNEREEVDDEGYTDPEESGLRSGNGIFFRIFVER